MDCDTRHVEVAASRICYRGRLVRSALRTNFVIAVWLTVALGVLFLWAGWPTPTTDFHLGRYSPGSGAVQMGFACIVREIGLWFYQFREDSNDNASCAGFVGGLLLTALAYLSFSHLAHALRCWSNGRKSVLDL